MRNQDAFLSTPSARRATFQCSHKSLFGTKFLSTPSARRATGGRLKRQGDPHISIHALREEGDRSHPRCTRQGQTISIHALREEGDTPAVVHHVAVILISIHALREEGDSGGR